MSDETFAGPCAECGKDMYYRGVGRYPRFCSRKCQLKCLNRSPERTYAGRKAAKK